MGHGGDQSGNPTLFGLLTLVSSSPFGTGRYFSHRQSQIAWHTLVIIILTVQTIVLKHPARVWYESPEARKLQEKLWN